MDNDTQEVQRLFHQIMDVSLIIAGVSCAAYSLTTQQVPLILGFVPLGEITAENHPLGFWGFIAVCIALAVIGTIQLVRARPKR